MFHSSVEHDTATHEEALDIAGKGLEAFLEGRRKGGWRSAWAFLCCPSLKPLCESLHLVLQQSGTSFLTHTVILLKSILAIVSFSVVLLD